MSASIVGLVISSSVDRTVLLEMPFFGSLHLWGQSVTLPQTVAPVITLDLFDHCAGGTGLLEARNGKDDRMRARHFGFDVS